MIKKVLAGAALASAATLAASGAASAHTSGPGAENMTATRAGEMNSAARVAYGPTADGTGSASDFATRNGDTAIGGDASGILNTYGAPLVNVDLRCAVPNAEGVGGNVLGGPSAACPVAPVDQFDAPRRII
ncbi:hypothetical protein PV682_32035 [Streptomyces niveiscabiei]|uniref:hypothetical protein n=1 Tax=Streptomyces niveiscabiei TaxID=164115 RepID=UPI0029A2C11A|nr:hypothetical protein [Streptomyces niveiscabiei]MDX3386054.1 hypothetical protein [Streptomyces niveiscabiei]